MNKQAAIILKSMLSEGYQFTCGEHTDVPGFYAVFFIESDDDDECDACGQLDNPIMWHEVAHGQTSEEAIKNAYHLAVVGAPVVTYEKPEDFLLL